MEKKRALDYLPLYKAASLGDWSTATKFFEEDPEALVARISTKNETALHVAIASGHSITFVKNLVDLMTMQGKPFDSRANVLNTALHYAAKASNLEAAKLLADKDPWLHMTKTKSGYTPLHVAAQYGHKNTVRFLYSLIEDKSCIDFEATYLLNLLIIADFYGVTPNPTEYKYKSSKGGNIENLVGQKSATHLEEYKGGHYYYGFLKKIRDSKRKHNQALELLKLLISEAVISSAEKPNELLGPSSRLGTRYGTHELVTEVVKAYSCCNASGRRLAQHIRCGSNTPTRESVQSIVSNGFKV